MKTLILSFIVLSATAYASDQTSCVQRFGKEICVGDSVTVFAKVSNTETILKDAKVIRIYTSDDYASIQVTDAGKKTEYNVEGLPLLVGFIPDLNDYKFGEEIQNYKGETNKVLFAYSRITYSELTKKLYRVELADKKTITLDSDQLKIWFSPTGSGIISLDGEMKNLALRQDCSNRSCYRSVKKNPTIHVMSSIEWNVVDNLTNRCKIMGPDTDTSNVNIIDFKVWIEKEVIYPPVTFDRDGNIGFNLFQGELYVLASVKAAEATCTLRK